ncbi:MAG: hypothetical protein ACR2LA_02730 [Acidimicrobiales bacterium]
MPAADRRALNHRRCFHVAAEVGPGQTDGRFHEQLVAEHRLGGQHRRVALDERAPVRAGEQARHRA